jgi:hypothetical protein
MSVSWAKRVRENAMVNRSLDFRIGMMEDFRDQADFGSPILRLRLFNLKRVLTSGGLIRATI